ncbi:formate dehydrogenase major subunit [Carboxydocella thermautotrophica]|nr:formate dehydrogenase major subunit [Carboxydocella thermautotrophica]
MTNHWIDLQNTDCALIIGSNAAENHPIAFKWLNEARRKRGAKIIHVDPRFNRTSAQADIYIKLRPGTDIAFMGGLINYVLTGGYYDRDYMLAYTNAAYLVNPGFKFEDGLFSGYDPVNRSYNQDSWSFQRDAAGNILTDPTLTNPATVWQLLKQHYSRYTPERVAATCGMTVEEFLQVASLFAATGARDKTGTILYAMGATQHSVGSQNVRSYAILQLLLGNIGKPGGGINALRGESNVQGSTDLGLLYDSLPGYLASPTSSLKHQNLTEYNKNETPAQGYWVNKPRFMVSLLKAWYGPAAVAEKDFAYHYLPKRNAAKNYSYINLFEDIYEGTIKGLLCFGQNPLVSGPNAGKTARALAKLQWLVVADLWETETAAFWKAPGVNPAEINTEVFILPVAAAIEKSGCITNSGRWLQYRWQALNPPGQAQNDAWIVHNLCLKLKGLYATSLQAKDEPIRQLYWPYGAAGEPDLNQVRLEMNGYTVADGMPVSGFSQLQADGSTACGIWIYSGFYTATGNKSQNRNNVDDSGIGSYPGWGYAWPANRRILYNRAAADPQGQPWHADKAVIWWDGLRWTGKDVPDFNASLSPTAAGGNKPFIMLPDGVGALFGKLKDGPFPEHYEPYESPVANQFSSVQTNPVLKPLTTALNARGTSSAYPFVATTYRVSEHWQTGAMTRNLPWQAELMPEMFVEISETLAASRGIANGDWVIVSSARGEIKARALVTKRVKPLPVNGQLIEQIGLPWHWGHQGVVTGEMANVLTPNIGDANTMIPEYKAFLVNIRKVV